MARGRSGVISKEYKGEDNTAYHDVIKLFKIYRVVNWQMQIKISQVKRRFHMEYGTDVDEFLDTIYQAGMDVERDLASEKERVEAISRSNQYLRLIDEAVDLMRRYHPQGERYYWVLYYSYLSLFVVQGFLLSSAGTGVLLPFPWFDHICINKKSKNTCNDDRRNYIFPIAFLFFD